ncbi:MAG TPA: hypothetical protein VFB60_12305 [Ktedonobacteraceae bacterium]|nr:hypothetical protein [Ktedonobacteraceae bacterium]
MPFIAADLSEARRFLTERLSEARRASGVGGRNCKTESGVGRLYSKLLSLIPYNNRAARHSYGEPPPQAG